MTLPAGPLREPPEAIRRADIVLINHCDEDGGHRIDMSWLQRMCPDVPVATARYQITGITEARTGADVSLQELRHHPVYAFCGIARPENFMKTLAEAGANVVGRQTFTDHHVFTFREKRKLMKSALSAGADALITTEKDIVRLPIESVQGLPVFYLKVGLQVLSGEEAMWERIGEVVNVG